MKHYVRDLLRLLAGLTIFSFGIVATIIPALGNAPWDTFHQGLTQILGITFGQASILVGIIIVVITFFMEEPLGIGTVLNVVVIGLIVDVILQNHWIPYYPNLVYRVVLLFAGMLIIGIASWLYIGAGFGAGPRDGLMLTLMRKTGLSVSVSRIIVEVSAALIGFLLGGPLGIGTVLIFIFLGPIIGLWFRLVHFDTNSVEHKTFTIRDIKNRLGRNNA